MSLEHGHSVEEIAQRLASRPRVSYLRDWVYGGIDGAVTTFAVAAGVAGANLSAGIVLILGTANLLADGFSMAAANYSGTKSEREEFDRLLEIEKKHIALVPDGEREEIRQAFARKGFSGEQLEQIVATISSNQMGWAQTMMLEEYGLAPVLRSPLVAALSTFIAFAIFGAIPLLPYLLGGSFWWSAIATVLAFFAIGSVKSRWSLRSPLASGLETVLIGSVAAGLAYIAGVSLAEIWK
jgi:VIT1/CCC1 family predicted Fe2+/Mn2+ transporter